MIRLGLAALAILAVTSAQAAKISATQAGASGMIFVEGEIKEGDAATFAEAAARFKTATVSLESGGGNLLNGIAIGSAINSRGFATVVPSGATCASICATMWLSGVERSAGARSRIGFHSAYLIVNGRPEESQKGNAIHGAFLRSIGVSDRVISYIMMAGPGSMTWMSQDAAKAIGIKYALVGNDGPAIPTPQDDFGRPTVYRDLKLRAAAFTQPTKGADACRMILLADGDREGRSFITVDVPRKGKATPAVGFHTAAIHVDGQPRAVAIDGEAFELDRGANSAVPQATESRRLVSAMRAAKSVSMVARLVDGSSRIYRYSTDGLDAAVKRTSAACGRRAA